MRYHVPTGVCPPQIVIAAPWPNSGCRELPSVELVPKVTQGKGISRSHCSPSSLLIFNQNLCHYSEFFLVICSREYNQRPCLQMVSVALMISPVLASGICTVPLHQRGTEDCVKYLEFVKFCFPIKCVWWKNPTCRCYYLWWLQAWLMKIWLCMCITSGTEWDSGLSNLGHWWQGVGWQGEGSPGRNWSFPLVR